MGVKNRDEDIFINTWGSPLINRGEDIYKCVGVTIDETGTRIFIKSWGLY